MDVREFLNKYPDCEKVGSNGKMIDIDKVKQKARNSVNESKTGGQTSEIARDFQSIKSAPNIF